jgi:hypothetical protein
MNLNAGRTVRGPSDVDRPMGEDKPLCTERQCPNELPVDPTPESQDGPDFDEDIIAPSEPTPCVRTTYRMLMGLFPAILAVFLSKSVITTIETASGLLAPPFVIIFPGKFLIIIDIALMTLKLRSEGKIEMNGFLNGALWVFVIVLGVGSYVMVTLKIL